MNEHGYNTVGVTSRQSGHFSDDVAKKAFKREDGGLLVLFTGMSGNITHWQVPSSSSTDMRNVEYDLEHNTFRCTCKWGFYQPKPNTYCHHMLIVHDLLPVGFHTWSYEDIINWLSSIG